VFADPQARHQLEAITHPRIRAAMVAQLAAADSPYVVLVSPLLFETTQHELVHRTLLVDVAEEIQRQRASARDGQSVEAIERIMAAQMPRTQRQALADDIVLNNGTLAELHQQLLQLHPFYLQLARSAP
jgi:dephospho-CoA kinase